jgi:hypothetical protein
MVPLGHPPLTLLEPRWDTAAVRRLRGRWRRGVTPTPGLREHFRGRRLLPVCLDHHQAREVFLE